MGLRAITGAWKHGMLVDSGGSYLSLCRVVCQSEHVCTWMLVDSGGSDLSSCRVVCQSEHVCTWITIRFRKHSGNPEKLRTVLESLEFVWMLVSPLLFLPQSHIISLI